MRKSCLVARGAIEPYLAHMETISDVACVTRAINYVPGSVVLVGHSYGGTLITKAAITTVSAPWSTSAPPDDDETSQQQQNKFARTPVFKHIEVADDHIYLKEPVISHFCSDLPPEEQKLLLATGAVPIADLFDQQVPGTAWRTTPSWAIVGNQDQTVSPDLERAGAERMKAKTVALDSSHAPMLSQPKAVLDVIREAARSLG